ncbi:hypothetical protein HMPREF1620_00491, partial [Escherichia coli 909945-2]
CCASSRYASRPFGRRPLMPPACGLRASLEKKPGHARFTLSQ